MVMFPFTGDRTVVTFVTGGGNWPEVVDVYKKAQAIAATWVGNAKGNRWMFD